MAASRAVLCKLQNTVARGTCLQHFHLTFPKLGTSCSFWRSNPFLADSKALRPLGTTYRDMQMQVMIIIIYYK